MHRNAANAHWTLTFNRRQIWTWHDNKKHVCHRAKKQIYLICVAAAFYHCLAGWRHWWTPPLQFMSNSHRCSASSAIPSVNNVPRQQNTWFNIFLLWMYTTPTRFLMFFTSSAMTHLQSNRMLAMLLFLFFNMVARQHCHQKHWTTFFYFLNNHKVHYVGTKKTCYLSCLNDHKRCYFAVVVHCYVAFYVHMLCNRNHSGYERIHRPPIWLFNALHIIQMTSLTTSHHRSKLLGF